MKANTKLEEKREAATDAKAVLCGLTPASARTDLRTATYKRLESRQLLNESSSQAAKLLNAVSGMLDRRRLDHNSIEEGKAAVQAWLDAIS